LNLIDGDREGKGEIIYLHLLDYLFSSESAASPIESGAILYS